ncbi:MAG: DUF3050 domain-containing protein [Rubripirellula sp.]
MNHLDRITNSILPLQKQLVTHPIYDAMKSIEDVRVFMESHVFAVWDFMVILKSLQRSLTCTEMVWLPAFNPQTCRLINEIVLCEESDEDGQGGYASHFELYLRSMKGCRADTTQIDRFVDLLRCGAGVLDALEQLDIPKCTRSFVYRTMSTALQGQVCEVAASFAFGREDLLPGVFERVVTETEKVGNHSFDQFVYYLKQHIEVDGDSHGPMAEQMIASLCRDDGLKWQLAEEAAIRSLQSRIKLWDGVLEEIQRPNRSKSDTHAGEETEFAIGHDFLASAVQLGWLDGLSANEISQQLQMPRDQIDSILGVPTDGPSSPTGLDA